MASWSSACAAMSSFSSSLIAVLFRVDVVEFFVVVVVVVLFGVDIVAFFVVVLAVVDVVVVVVVGMTPDGSL